MNKTKIYLLSLLTIGLATIGVGLTFFFSGNIELTKGAFGAGFAIFALAAMFLPPVLDLLDDN